jgi:hypothetical protein
MPKYRKLVGIVALATAFAIYSVDADAQQARVAKIGWLRARPVAIPGSASVEIQRRLSELGYIDGNNIAFEYRYTDGIGATRTINR